MEDEDEKKFFDQHYPNKESTYYDILEIPRNSSLDDIKRAYRKLAIKYHPKNNPNDEAANKKFLQINEAYNALSSQDKRESYDNLLWGSIMPVRAHNIF